MKCLILAAGYATRLYPLTEKVAKPLLPVKGVTILDRLVLDIDALKGIDEIIIVTNHKFAKDFKKWKDECNYNCKITIIDDGSTQNDNRLGAVRDITYAIKTLGINDELMVLAGDNLLDFSLKGFVDFYNEKKAPCVMRHYEASVEKLQRTGVAIVDECCKIINMQEKPKVPKSNWAIPPFYIYPKEALIKIKECVENNKCNVDAPGDFIAWFCSQETVYAWEMPGKRYDIGTLDNYNKVK